MWYLSAGCGPGTQGMSRPGSISRVELNLLVLTLVRKLNCQHSEQEISIDIRQLTWAFKIHRELCHVMMWCSRGCFCGTFPLQYTIDCVDSCKPWQEFRLIVVSLFSFLSSQDTIQNYCTSYNWEKILSFQSCDICVVHDNCLYYTLCGELCPGTYGSHGVMIHNIKGLLLYDTWSHMSSITLHMSIAPLSTSWPIIIMTTDHLCVTSSLNITSVTSHPPLTWCSSNWTGEKNRTKEGEETLENDLIDRLSFWHQVKSNNWEQHIKKKLILIWTCC